jgi:hypothetical protein
MPKKSKLRDYFPKQVKISLIQARVDAELAKKAKVLLEKEGIGWNEFFESALKRYLIEETGSFNGEGD